LEFSSFGLSASAVVSGDSSGVIFGLLGASSPFSDSSSASAVNALAASITLCSFSLGAGAGPFVVSISVSVMVVGSREWVRNECERKICKKFDKLESSSGKSLDICFWHSHVGNLLPFTHSSFLGLSTCGT
jgi:hypothetical protein